VPQFILSILAVIRVFLRSRTDTALEVLALRQQVAVLKRKRPRPTLNSLNRIHDALEKDTPSRRPVEQKPNANSTVISMPRLGGLLHRYSWQQAA
jgi:hypothetical protein